MFSRRFWVESSRTETCCFGVSLALWSYFDLVTEEMPVKEDPCRANLTSPPHLRDLIAASPDFVAKQNPSILRDVYLTYYTSDTTIPWHVTGKHAPSMRRARVRLN